MQQRVDASTKREKAAQGRRRSVVVVIVLLSVLVVIVPNYKWYSANFVWPSHLPPKRKWSGLEALVIPGVLVFAVQGDIETLGGGEEAHIVDYAEKGGGDSVSWLGAWAGERAVRMRGIVEVPEEGEEELVNPSVVVEAVRRSGREIGGWRNSR